MRAQYVLLISIGIGFIDDIVKPDGVLIQLHELVAMISDIIKSF